jgi:glyoxylase-like metal-dependent hydrolase (beta-lactamase superfamily II)
MAKVGFKVDGETKIRSDNINTLSRRDLIRTGGAGALAGVGLALADTAASAQERARTVNVDRHAAKTPFPLNAYVVEGENGLVVVDAMLTNTASRELRARVDGFGKPLRAVLLTHPHPDHYAGLGNLTEGLDIPIVSVAEINDIARRDDAKKDAVISGMFGEEWPRNRVFPNDTVGDGDTLDFGPGLRFTVMDVGPAESFHDSIFVLEGATPAAFVGDLVYPFMHPYMADNTNPEWKRAIGRLRSELPEDMILHVGHGLPATPAFLAWQEAYLDRFEAALQAADWSDPETAQAAVVTDMTAFLPSDELLFFLKQSIVPNARRLGLAR